MNLVQVATTAFERQLVCREQQSLNQAWTSGLAGWQRDLALVCTDQVTSGRHLQGPDSYTCMLRHLKAVCAATPASVLSPG